MRAKHLVYLTAAVILAAACCAGVSASNFEKGGRSLEESTGSKEVKEDGPKSSLIQRKTRQHGIQVSPELLNKSPPTTNIDGGSTDMVNIHIETVEDKDKPRRNKRKDGEKRQKSSKSGGSSDTKRRKRRNQVETGISTDPDSQSVNNIQLVDIQPSETSLERELDKQTWESTLSQSMRALALAFEAYALEWTRVAQAKIKPEESLELEQRRQALLSALDPTLNCREASYRQNLGSSQMDIEIRCHHAVGANEWDDIVGRLKGAITARYPDRPNNLPEIYVRPETHFVLIYEDWQRKLKRIPKPVALNRVGDCVAAEEGELKAELSNFKKYNKECEQLLRFSKHGSERAYLTLVLTDAEQSEAK
jgi:hypothetical protein